MVVVLQKCLSSFCCLALACLVMLANWSLGGSIVGVVDVATVCSHSFLLLVHLVISGKGGLIDFFQVGG